VSWNGTELELACVEHEVLERRHCLDNDWAEVKWGQVHEKASQELDHGCWLIPKGERPKGSAQ
jgi:hypothetical protein